jgi:hypothetical protein
MNLTGNAGVGMQRHDLKATRRGSLFLLFWVIEEKALARFCDRGKS